jgi:hypothetical protein
MPIYEIRCLDTSGHIRRTQTLVATNDLAAVREARMDRSRQQIEIWKGPRLISLIKHGDHHRALPRDLSRGDSMPAS